MKALWKAAWMEWRWYRASILVKKAYMLMYPEMTDEEADAFARLSAVMLKRQQEYGYNEYKS